MELVPEKREQRQFAQEFGGWWQKDDVSEWLSLGLEWMLRLSFSVLTVLVGWQGGHLPPPPPKKLCHLTPEVFIQNRWRRLCRNVEDCDNRPILNSQRMTSVNVTVNEHYRVAWRWSYLKEYFFSFCVYKFLGIVGRLFSGGGSYICNIISGCG